MSINNNYVRRSFYLHESVTSGKEVMPVEVVCATKVHSVARILSVGSTKKYIGTSEEVEEGTVPLVLKNRPNRP